MGEFKAGTGGDDIDWFLGRAHYISGFDPRVLKSCTAYLAATMFRSLCRR